MALSTIGTDLWYCPSSGGLTPPATGYTVFADLVTDFPGLASTVNSIQTTPVNEPRYHRYVPGLADPGGSVDVTVNIGVDELDEIDKIKAAAAGATEKGVLWFAEVHPQLTTEAFVFKGSLGAIGVPALTVDANYQTTVSITPTYIPEQPQPKPTLTTP